MEMGMGVESERDFIFAPRFRPASEGEGVKTTGFGEYQIDRTEVELPILSTTLLPLLSPLHTTYTGDLPNATLFNSAECTSAKIRGERKDSWVFLLLTFVPKIKNLTILFA